MDPAQLMFAYNHCSEYYHEFVPQPDAYVQYSETYSCDGFVQMGNDLAAMNLNPPASPLPDVDLVVSVSTAFHPTSHPHLPPSNILLSSSDAVLFYVHSSILLRSCPELFTAILLPDAPLSHPQWYNMLITLPAPAAEVNIIIHMLYGSSPVAHSPSFETLANAIDHMPGWGITPSTHITPSTPLYTLLLSHAPLHPLDIYSLAAHHGVHSLAVSTSSHLLAYSLSTITDKQAERIGAIYLKKLLLLHVERGVALKKILLKPPHPHSPSKECGFDEQKRLTRAWAFASAYLVLHATPDLSTHTMHSTLNPLTEHLECEQCHEALRDRIKDVIAQWASVGILRVTESVPFTDIDTVVLVY